LPLVQRPLVCPDNGGRPVRRTGKALFRPLLPGEASKAAPAASHRPAAL